MLSNEPASLHTTVQSPSAYSSWGPSAIGERCRRWIHRLPAVPLAWGVALSVWLERTIWETPVSRMVHRRASGWSLSWLALSPDDIVAIVHRAVPGTRGSHQCLFRALVRFGLLHRTDTPATLCLGVQPPDAADSFAHAWVEVNDTPIGEATDPHTTHRVLARWDGSGMGVNSPVSPETKE